MSTFKPAHLTNRRRTLAMDTSIFQLQIPYIKFGDTQTDVRTYSLSRRSPARLATLGGRHARRVQSPSTVLITNASASEIALTSARGSARVDVIRRS
ncbi:hypothetical protein EVAR_3950_1 [Eumeta japonica]|uniref:Uncharacterized protein n=1 Tax=Eumeta variegata TaxID=151549 RepID=A0A4C1STN1_EUMVA|nr:hypothetical protein EVAR_3950_1 [Eumeta japonica]